MPSSGSGTGTPIPFQPTVVDYSLLPIGICAMSLPEYASMIGYDECAFYGVYYDGQIEYDCRMFWTEWQRLDVYRSLREAQELMENVMGYPLCRTWVTGQPTEFGNQFYVDEQDYTSNPLLLRWGHFIQAGVRATSTLAAGAVVSYATEPATVGPIAVTINDIKEVKVYSTGTEREIKPVRMVYAGGNLTLYIPRCRLVAVPNTTDEGMDYNVIDNFAPTVDIKREYNDPSVGATLVRPHQCGYTCSSVGCSEYTQTACIYPRDKRLGIVDLVPATYVSGWTAVSTCYPYSMARLNYLCGLNQLDNILQSALVRLAHARMASEPCNCTVVQALWERDRKVPDVLTREQINCPFGPSTGAFTAYKVAQSRRIVRARVL